MPEPRPWKPRVEKRPHRFGEPGVIGSLEEVAKRVSRGALSPRVRMWAIECLDRAREQERKKADNERERAEILLSACQRKLWVPDPVGAEYMAGSHLMACDPTKDGVCFRGGDCDDLVVLLGACFSSVGLYTAVVGHAYDAEKNIMHVLTAVWIPGTGWQYADPSSSKLKLGECVQFTRERIYSVPNVRMICDSDVCFTSAKRFEPEKHQFVVKGDFVGVDGIPEEMREPPRIAWLVDPPDGWKPSMLGDTNVLDICAKVPSDCLRRVCREFRGTRGSFSEDDLKAYTKAAAACGAEIACANVGVPPPLTDICGRIGAEIAAIAFEGTKKAVNAIKDFFTRGKSAAQKAQQRFDHVRDFFDATNAALESVAEAQLEATRAVNELVEQGLILYRSTTGLGGQRVTGDGSGTFVFSPKNQRAEDLVRLRLVSMLKELGLLVGPERISPLNDVLVHVRDPGAISQFSGVNNPRTTNEAAMINELPFKPPDWTGDLFHFVEGRLRSWSTMPSREAADTVKSADSPVRDAVGTIRVRIDDWFDDLERVTPVFMSQVADMAAQQVVMEEFGATTPKKKKKSKAPLVVGGLLVAAGVTWWAV